MLFCLYALWRGAVLLCRNPKIEVVFGGSVLVTPLVLILARLFGRKAIVQAHGLDVIYSNRLYQAMCVRWVTWCDRVVANSTYTGSLIEKKMVGPGSSRLFLRVWILSVSRRDVLRSW